MEIIKSTSFRGKSLAHCEIKPEHLYGLDDKLGIIDAEWASNNILEHYDIVSCYARTFTIARNPRVADDLLSKYYSRLVEDRADINHFKRQFRGLLAWRAVGEYTDGYKLGRLSKEYSELIERVLNNDFDFS